MAKAIIVSDKGLSDCGMSEYSGIPLEVISLFAKWQVSKFMYVYTVKLPDGGKYTFRSYQGITETTL